jgi:hypothetical protein
LHQTAQQNDPTPAGSESDQDPVERINFSQSTIKPPSILIDGKRKYYRDGTDGSLGLHLTSDDAEIARVHVTQNRRPRRIGPDNQPTPRAGLDGEHSRLIPSLPVTGFVPLLQGKQPSVSPIWYSFSKNLGTEESKPANG